MAMAGVDPMTIQQLGAWRTLQMVQRYAHLSPDHKRQAIERLTSSFAISSRDGDNASQSKKSQLAPELVRQDRC
jgi:hypothetical protein